jgi:hypothetical protein
MIAVKGMEMPSCCMMCDFCKEVPYTGELYCNITASDILNDREKLDDCPLVEVITCKNCMYNNYGCDMMEGCEVPDDYFCAFAERKE